MCNGLPCYSILEVLYPHCERQDWLILGDKVYDVSPFIENNENGQEIIDSLVDETSAHLSLMEAIISESRIVGLIEPRTPVENKKKKCTDDSFFMEIVFPILVSLFAFYFMKCVTEIWV